MLKHLSITNYAIIDNLQLDLRSGFSVITGETGAGKSILLGALSLILGNRADTTVLNNKEKKCIVEGEVMLSANFKSFFDENDLDFDENTILRREISVNGKSRAFINDTPVNLITLKNLSTKLIDVHSQSESLLLRNPSFQIDVLDTFANNAKNISTYKDLYRTYKAKKNELEALESKAHKSSTDNDYLKFQIKEIEDLKLLPNEKEDIEGQLSLIGNAEEIKQNLNFSANSLIESDENILGALKEVKNRLSKIESYSNEYKILYDRLSSSIIELEDIGFTINNINNDFDFDQENIIKLNDRLSKIYSIEQKHKLNSTNEILKFLSELTKKIEESSNYEEKANLLRLEVSEMEKSVISEAKKIEEVRLSVKDKFEKQVKRELSSLGMPDAVFEVKISSFEIPVDKGINQVEFLFSANKGIGVNSLSKIASGGELSRLMLVIKMFLVKGKSLSTIIFDEIDTGVSGDIANKMAEMMLDMSSSTQVLAITHLPQVAAKGNIHYKIIKENTGKNTYSKVLELSNTDRVMELAKMLSSDKVSDAAIKNANALLESN